MSSSTLALPLALALLGGCAGPGPGTPGATGWDCLLGETTPASASQLGCWEDFLLLASEPLDATIPGARSAKTVLDRLDGDALYFQDSVSYPLHWDFAAAWLSGGGLPLVPDQATFSSTEYTSPDRRFLLGAVTFYEEPAVWAYEIAPYDTASAEMIALAFRAIRDNAWFGEALRFHPGSEAVAAVAAGLPGDVPVVTTEELFAGTSYQPLSLGTSLGQLAFYDSEDLAAASPGYREIVVLDEPPAELGVVAGIITSSFQTPLSHLAVLSQSRGTPNMALVGASQDAGLRALEGQWVELSVQAMDWSIRQVDQAEADAWWEANKPEPIEISPMDLSVQALTDEGQILDLEDQDLAQALAEAIPVFGGKAAHYGALATIGEAVPHPVAFAVPVYHYDAFMRDNGLWEQVEAMLADPDFGADAGARHAMLAELRAAMLAAPVDPALLGEIEARIIAGTNAGLYPWTRFRFRSSTNAEDLSGFNGAGLYSSSSGDPHDDDLPVEAAIKETWASLWSDRATDEREYYSIDHRAVGMALLCHQAFPDEEANGVAITGNSYDTSGLEPAFYVNAQVGEASVVQPDPGVTSDQLLYYYGQPGQPVVYLQRSSLLDDGQTVLDQAQLQALGAALAAVHERFLPVYGAGSGFYAMDTEFKLDEDPWTGELTLYLDQARPYPGWGSAD